MKRPKSIAAMLLAGFLAFAPPGTLIAGAALAIALFGYCTGTGDRKEPTPQAPQSPQQRQPRPQPTASPTPGAAPAPRR